MKALSCFSHVFMNWNDFVEWYNEIDNDMCIACCTNICCAFKNVVPSFLICSNASICSCLHFKKIDYIFFVTNLYFFVK